MNKANTILEGATKASVQLPALADIHPMLSGTGVSHAEVDSLLVSVHDEMTDSILQQALDELAARRKIAVLFKSVVPKHVCDAAAKRLENHHLQEAYAVDQAVGRIGVSLYEIQFGSKFERQYWDTAAVNRGEVHKIFSPYGAPLDHLQTQCDGLPGFNGANLLRVGGRSAFVGLLRTLKDGAAILPHIDCARWDMPSSLECQQIDCQIAVNFYLNMPKLGGEITIYNQRMSKLEYDANRRPKPHDYALREDCLTQNSVTIRPDIGDMLFFNAEMPHRVSETEGETRYTSSSFLGVRRDRSLVFFS